MDKKSVKIFLACFLGVLTGMLLTQTINVLVGIISAIAIVCTVYKYETVLRVLSKILGAMKIILPKWQSFKDVLKVFFLILSNVFAMYLIFLIAGQHSTLTIVLFLLAIYFMQAIVILLVPNKTLQEKVNIAVTCNLFCECYLIPKVLILLIINTPKIARRVQTRIRKIYPYVRDIPIALLLAAFFVIDNIAAFLKFIHTYEILLCLFDMSIGMVVGYLLGNMLIGATLGGLLGVANYELVSKRWLKLIPRQQK